MIKGSAFLTPYVKYKILVLFLTMSSFSSVNAQATDCNLSSSTHFVWTGAISTEWTDPGNWDQLSGYPNTSTEGVSIPLGLVKYPVLSENITIKHFCIKGGSLDLNDYDLNITGDAFFDDGSLLNGSSALSTINVSGATSELVFNSVQIYCAITGTVDRVYLNGSIFHAQVDLIVDNASTTVSSTGGNVFHDDVSLENNGAATWILSASGSAVDIFNGNSTFINSGSGIFKIAESGSGNTFNGSVKFECKTEGSLTIAESASNTIFYDDVTFKVNSGASISSYPSIVVSEDGGATVFYRKVAFEGSEFGRIYFGLATGSGAIELQQTAYICNTANPLEDYVRIYFANLTQNNSTPQTLTGTGGVGFYIQDNVIFNGTVEFSCTDLEIAGATFNGNTTIESVNTTGLTSPAKDNYFNGPFTFILDNVTSMLLTGNNYFNSDVNFDLTNASLTLDGSAVSNYFRGNILLSGNAGSIYIETMQVDGNLPQVLQDSRTGISKLLGVGYFTIDKSAGDFQIETKLSIGQGGTLTFVRGAIIASSSFPVVFTDMSSTHSGASNLSYVNGPVQLTLIEDYPQFTFPIGKNRNYLPLTISTHGNLKSPPDDPGYVAEYFNVDQPLFTIPKTSYDNCEYWTLEPLDPGSPEVEVSLSWNSSSCNITQNYGYLEVLDYNDGSGAWVSYGQSALTPPIGSNPGIVRSNMCGSPCLTSDYGVFVLGTTVSPASEPAVGFSYNLFGVGTVVTGNADLIVNGNIYIAEAEPGDPGFFTNDGEIYLTRDWINLSNQRALKSGGEGTVHFSGEYQRITGHDEELDVTQFYGVELSGGDKKELFIDAWIENSLALNDIEFSCRNRKLVINTFDYQAISRSTGYISADQENGRLQRYIDNTDSYLFPLGSSKQITRYRPITIANSDGSSANVIEARFVNHSPGIDGYDPAVKLPHIIEVGTDFYYLLNHITTSPIICASDDPPNSSANSPLCNPGGSRNPSESFDIKFEFYYGIDGAVQSIGHWDDNSAPNVFSGYNNPGLTPTYPSFSLPFWKSAGPINNYDLSSTYPTMNYLEVESWNDFSNEPFGLISSGIIIGTGNFGNGPGGAVGWTTGGGGVYGSGNGSGTTVPSGPPGSGVQITIIGNNNNTGLGLNIPVGGGGTVSGPPTTTGSGGGTTSYPLDPDLYNSSGPTIVFNSVPPNYRIPDCESDEIIMNYGNPSNPLKIETYENFIVNTAISSSDYNLLFYDQAGTLINPGNPYMNNYKFTSVGVYSYELTTGGKTFKGQFIVE